MLIINKEILKYTCDISNILDNLLMDTSYESSENLNGIICEDRRSFVVNRLEKALYRVVDIFGDAYVPLSLYIDEDGVCGFSVSITGRVIEGMSNRLESLDIMINDYIVFYVKSEWHEFLGAKLSNVVGLDELWRNVNSLFSYKSTKSYVVEEL